MIPAEISSGSFAGALLFSGSRVSTFSFTGTRKSLYRNQKISARSAANDGIKRGVL
jgi:hypothetical protein